MIDRHHLLYERAQWNSSKYGKELRGTPSLIPHIDRELHDEIHRNCPPVPMLGNYALARTLTGFEPTTNTIQTIGRLQSALERATRPSRAHPLERDLAGLAIEALDLQIPFIREALLRS